MEHEEKVTVIIPTYNCQEYIERCIGSILEQNYSPIEIIVIDDSSSDDTQKVCKKYIDSHQIIYEKCKNNAGVSCARNRGIDLSTGDLIVFVDADDFVSCDYIDVLYEMHMKYPKLLAMSMMQGFSENVERTNQAISTIKMISKREYFNNQYVIHPWACAVIYEASIIKKNHIRFYGEARFAEDAYFVNKYLHYCDEIVLSDAKTYYYYIREDGGAISKKGKNYSREDAVARASALEAYNDALKYYREHHDDEEKYLKSGFSFLAADILLIMERAKMRENAIENKLRSMLSLKNIVIFLRYCHYPKHIMLVIGMKIFPRLVYAVLG